MEPPPVRRESHTANIFWACYTFEPIIAQMDQHPFPLASKPLGQALGTAAQETSRELMEPLNGCDYHLYMRRAGQETEKLVGAFFHLLAKPDANETIRFIIRTNIRVLRELRRVCDDERRALARRGLIIIDMGRGASGERHKAHLRRFLREVCVAIGEHKRWINILSIEISLSEVALRRLGIAGKAAELVQKQKAKTISEEESETLETLFIEFQSWRAVLIQWVLQLNEMTGNHEFLRRHRNELWDIVDRDLEG
ncbi:uncharacterized protein Z520_08173 [Fonsecaea multimorphosa CBS 102226]|uniref:Uncharacterized protein n=1 Tax=Fonsecaea multimorphosa CBS 102226 TaxID=1442371 RepID=A0A0D2KH12_9EURO|nr:uncharacterized protein Z520_08173 [Fonsecaea multimorphosa CBS 102226]KIX95918.1 hypothetical protein Z520_08173 [Fonsecaea multimorphosa CBS 102226]